MLWKTCVVLATCLWTCTRGFVLGGVHGNGSCTHNFQVLTLDDNIQFKLFELRQRIDGVSLQTRNELLTLENRLLAARNVSDEVQRELLKSRCALVDRFR